VFIVHEDVVVLVHFKDQAWKLKSTLSVRGRYTLSNRAKLLICVAVEVARA
jgi:hypothetical protein